MADTKRWKADRAWLGGDQLARDVLIETSADSITAVESGYKGEFDSRLKGVVIPGLVSAHSHAFHRALRGRTHHAGGDFWVWRELMYQLANRLSPQSYQALATVVFSEMLRSGITTVGEFHYVHHRSDGSQYSDANAMGEALVTAASQTGIRLTLIEAAYLRSDTAGTPPTAEQTRFSDGSIEAWSERVREMADRLSSEANVRLGVAAHSVRAVGPEDLESIALVARELSVPLHVHVSEQPGENQDCLASHGVTPVELLHRQGFLGAGTTLVHATHTTESDRALIASTGSGVCLCPTTEADLGDGIGPAIEYQQSGVAVSLGSDSNAIIDILEEARRVEHHDRVRLGRRGVHQSASLLEAATRGGARSLGWPDAGRIQPGAPADFVVLEATSIDLAGSDWDQAAASIVMSATRGSVANVIVGGTERVLNEIPELAEVDTTINRVWQ